MTEAEKHFHRMLGVRDGLSHALISIRAVKGSLLGPGRAYLPPERHARKRERVLNKVVELERVEAIIARQLNDVCSAIRGEPKE